MFLASWRKKAHFCHANALAQQWFLTTEWHGLGSVMLNTWSEKPITAQVAVTDAVTKALSQCEINSKGDTPKLTRCSITLDVFREMAGIIRPGVEYFNKLQAKYQVRWWKVGGAKKLGRRVLIDGEAGLRGTFLAAYEHCGRDVSKLSFSENSDWE